MAYHSSLHRQSIMACIWDFDKTLIPGYMQSPLFEAFGINQDQFWKEVNALPGHYEQRGLNVSPDTIYLNHLLSYIKNGPLKGLTNSRLRELGQELVFYPGLPEFFMELRSMVDDEPAYSKKNIHLEHYIISTGLAEMIRGSRIAPYVDGIFGCEFIENPLPPNYISQTEFSLPMDPEISQIGVMVDNTVKTRFIFEINKGTNKNPEIDVNAAMGYEDRRVPLDKMIYIADGPSDVPVFSVVRKGGGLTYAVYNSDDMGEFAQNEMLRETGRIDNYGRADYRAKSDTAKWITLKVRQICDRMVQEHEEALARKVAKPPRHLHKDDQPPIIDAGKTAEHHQDELFGS
jgi:hypothetical protein